MSAPEDNSGGYGKPPKKNRFKPGQSGNPKGRPKGSRNLDTILEEELSQRVSVTENGKQRKVTKRVLAVRQQVNKAAQGDQKAFLNVLRIQNAAAASAISHPGAPIEGRSELTGEQCWEIMREWSLELRGNEP